jgi:ribosomal protein S12 methylthiotransferase
MMRSAITIVSNSRTSCSFRRCPTPALKLHHPRPQAESPGLPWYRKTVENSRLFSLISLGCPKNRVDSERLLSVMAAAGFVYTEDSAAAEVMIINTCAFIEPAVAESVDAILDFRNENPKAFLVVAGCLPLRYKQSLQDPLPEVDLFLTPDHIGDLPSKLPQPADRAGLGQQAPVLAAGRTLTTSGYAYLKIAEGCSRRCRYCTIPSIRGPRRSRDPEGLEEEVRLLASRGVRELVLVAQDLSGYGADRHEKGALTSLLHRLRTVDGIAWIRLMYLHPAGITNDLMNLVRDSDTVLPYLDIPFQHVSETVLKAMGRPWKGDSIRRLVDRLRKHIPGLVLRTTLMVGYPGEGEKEFQELRDFVVSYGIERVGVFSYCPEEGTRAAALGDPVPKSVKDERAAEICTIHAAFTAKRNRRRIGSVEQAIVEGVSQETDLLLQGRIWDQAPEVDGLLYITSGNAVAGEIHTVRITDAHGPDLFAVLEEMPSGRGPRQDPNN